jgi:hypothetical protein
VYLRRLLGILATGVALAATIVAARAFVPGVRAAIADRSMMPLAAGGLIAVVMLFVAALMAHLAYRNLFWARFVEAQRRRLEQHDHTV